jgi:hypothetical protein
MNPTTPADLTRQHIHTRQITANGFARSDGRWDIECELRDTKSYSFSNDDLQYREAGEPVHHMFVRLTLDDHMVVCEAFAEMRNTPFPECPGAVPPFANLVGSRIGKGWRAAVDAAMGDIRGCTHLRELLGVMATVAFQTMAGYKSKLRRETGEGGYNATTPSQHMGKCLGWDFNGPVVARIAPQFIGYERDRKG